MFNSPDHHCEPDGSKGILFVIIENDGWVFDNYSEIIVKNNISFKDITYVVDNPLRFGKLLTKD